MTKLARWITTLLVLMTWQSYGQSNKQVESLVDPTKPVRQLSTNELNEQGFYQDGFPDIKISAVFLTNEKRHAVINGETLLEGQIFKGLTVIKIHKNGVILSNADTQKEYLINNNNFLKDTTDDF